MNEGLPLKKEQFPEVMIYLLVEMYSHMKSLHNMLLLGAVQSNDQAVELMVTYARDLEKSKEEVLKTVFENYGEIDFSGLFEKKD